MATVLEEVTSEELDKAHVERRVEDWAARLERLYADIASWLPAGWRAQAGHPKRMHEELMREFGVPARDLPTLKLVGENGRSGQVYPSTLWIVPFNGMVSFRRDGSRFVIVDTAETFQPPNWQVAPAYDLDQEEPLTIEWLQRALQ